MFRLLPVLTLVGCVAPEAPLIRFSEVLPTNTTAAGGLIDYEGDSADWFELESELWEPEDLEGLQVVDDLGAVWNVTEGTVIDGRGLLLVFADGSPTQGAEVHAPLSLGLEGSLELLDTQGERIDRVEWPPLLADHSWSRFEDGWREASQPTPLAANAP